MPYGLAPPSFTFITDALLEQVLYAATCERIATPFMRGLPVSAPGIQHSYKLLQRRLILMAEGERLFRIMTPHEDEIRILCRIVPGQRVIS